MKARVILVAFVLMGSAKTQYFQQSFHQSASYFSSGPISVASVNGVLKLTVNGRTINIQHAKLIAEDAHTKILRPIELPEARILLPKNRNAIIFEYRGYHIESIDNGRIIKTWSST